MEYRLDTAKCLGNHCWSVTFTCVPPPCSFVCRNDVPASVGLQPCQHTLCLSCVDSMRSANIFKVSKKGNYPGRNHMLILRQGVRGYHHTCQVSCAVWHNRSFPAVKHRTDWDGNSAFEIDEACIDSHHLVRMWYGPVPGRRAFDSLCTL